MIDVFSYGVKMSCPYCGSQEIIYDFIHGYKVCIECGTVVDTIFIEHYEADFDKTHHMYKSEGLPSTRKGIEKKKIRSKLRDYSRMSLEIVIYEKYAKKSRKNVYVDINAALEKELKTNTKTRVYHHKDEDKVISLAEDPRIKMIIENIVDKDPILSSRTPRGKVALALIIKSIIDGVEPNINELCRLTSMSLVHVRRLISLVNKRMPYISKYISRLAKNGTALMYIPRR